MHIYKLVSVIILFILTFTTGILAQSSGESARAITMEEYEIAHTHDIEDMDNTTYVKFADGQYIFDRYEMRDPIYITGDDGLRKRVDIYTFIAREGLQELGTMIFYTNEKDELFKALIPNYAAAGEVWEQYFEDIHSINEIEENFVLKLSYVISRELSFQIYKGLNNGQIPISEQATYGSDICFPGDQLITLSTGESIALSQIKRGDKVLAHDPQTGNPSIVEVSRLISHTPSNYAILEMTLVKELVTETNSGTDIQLHFKTLKATPNHPMMTSSGRKEIGKIEVGEEILSWNSSIQTYESYSVFETREITEGIQPVYSVEATSGSTLHVNDVVVRQK